VAALLVVAVVIAAGCSNDGSSDGDGAGGPGSGSNTESSGSVIASTSIWADVATQVTCGELNVETLIPSGADPHGFEPALSDRASLDAAEVVIANGLGLEGGATSLLQDTSANVVWLGDEVQLEGSQPDPHIWMNPQVVMEAVGVISTAFNEAGVSDPATIERCSGEYLEQLGQLDTDVAARIESIPKPQRNIVTGHRALSAYADRYGLNVVATVIASSDSLRESTPAHLSDVVSEIQDNDVQAIFVDEFQESADVDAVAREAGGLPVVGVALESLGEPDTDSGTYLDMISSDTDVIVEALK
jgi:zinc/manganese transport system substrate-binding protein